MTIFVERFDIIQENDSYPHNRVKIIDKQKMVRLATIELNKEYKEKEIIKLAQYLCTCIDDAVSKGEIEL